MLLPCYLHTAGNCSFSPVLKTQHCLHPRAPSVKALCNSLALNQLVIFHDIISVLQRKRKKVKKSSPSLFPRSTHGHIRFCHLTYIMQRERCFVDSRTDQSINPKFVNVVHHLVFDSREDEINLRRFQNRLCVFYSRTSPRNHCLLLQQKTIGTEIIPVLLIVVGFRF